MHGSRLLEGCRASAELARGLTQPRKMSRIPGTIPRPSGRRPCDALGAAGRRHLLSARKRAAGARATCPSQHRAGRIGCRREPGV
jgi:hypothetical protein